MKKVFSAALIILLTSASCANKDKVNSTIIPAMTMEEYMADGYVQGVIQLNEKDEKPCDALIEVKGMGIVEVGDISKEFKKDGLPVWVKVIPQRRMSKCLGTTPAELTDIKKRES
jgi:thioredoxin-related protein